MESIDLGLSELEPISLSLDEPPLGGYQSSSFGPGIELLMNDKQRNANNKVNIDLSELDNMEKELNDLSQTTSGGGGGGNSKTIGLGSLANMFGFGGGETKKAEPDFASNSNLGQATKDTIGTTKTWDGFSKFNEIPAERSYSSSSSNLNEREKRRKKKLMLSKLEDMREKGYLKGGERFSLDSSFEESEDEYETALEDKRKRESVKLYGWWFMSIINTIEYANAAWNPLDVNLDGWGEQVSEDMSSYEEHFGELYEKWKGGKLAPEVAILMRIVFSACAVHFTNKALSSATPGFNDVIRQSPELMKLFTNATVSSMSQSSPSFGFVNNLVNQPEQVNKSFGPPPPPMETKNQAPPPRPGAMPFTPAVSGRPDINAARGAMFREGGVDMNNNFANPNRPDPRINTPAQPPEMQQQAPPPVQRAEMRGPPQLDILAGLKPKIINIHEPPAQPAMTYNEDDSMISISSLKDLNSANLPKRSNRKNRSNKNTVSLDI